MPTPTANFGWLKPDIGGSSGAWGSLWNTDLDDIDAVVAATYVAVGVVVAPYEINLKSAAAPAHNVIYGQVAAANRWSLYLGDGETETGGNAGSNFLIQSFSDTGAFVTNAFEITRATGSASFGAAVTVNTTLNVVGAAQINGSAGFLTGITFPNYYGHSFQFGWDGAHARIAVDGTDIGAIALAGSGGGGSFLPISGGTITGNLGINGTLTTNGAVGFSSTLSVSGAIASNGVISSSQYFNVAGTPTALFANELQFASGVTIVWTGGGLNFNHPSAPGGEMAEMDPSGNFFVSGQAFKPGGGSWGNSSDLRLKTVERPYELGLSEILKLAPIVYRFKGNDAAPGKASKLERVRDKSFVGLVAQEVESIFPGMVTKRRGHIDGKEVDDVRDLDTSELTFALLNAVKTLAARVAALEAKAA